MLGDAITSKHIFSGSTSTSIQFGLDFWNSAKRVNNSVESFFAASSIGVSLTESVPTVGSTLKDDILKLFESVSKISPMFQQKADKVSFASTNSVLNHTPILIDRCTAIPGKEKHFTKKNRADQ